LIGRGGIRIGKGKERGDRYGRKEMGRIYEHT
jgi:hypothetical protein